MSPLRGGTHLPGRNVWRLKPYIATYSCNVERAFQAGATIPQTGRRRLAIFAGKFTVNTNQTLNRQQVSYHLRPCCDSRGVSFTVVQRKGGLPLVALRSCCSMWRQTLNQQAEFLMRTITHCCNNVAQVVVPTTPVPTTQPRQPAAAGVFPAVAGGLIALMGIATMIWSAFRNVTANDAG